MRITETSTGTMRTIGKIGRYCAHHRDSTQNHASHRICGPVALPPRNDHRIHVGHRYSVQWQESHKIGVAKHCAPQK